MSLKTVDGKPLISTNRRTSFICFCVCIESTKILYHNLVEAKDTVQYLPLYKFSQDHLELLFGNVRSHGGANNNPTAQQFKRIL